MLETTKKLIGEIDDIMNKSMRYFEFNDFINMDKDQLEAIQKFVCIINTSKELMMEQAEMMEEQNKKLDLILKYLEEEAH